MITTLNKIGAYPLLSEETWNKLLAHLGKTELDDEPLPILTTLDALGIEGALQCIQAVEGHEKEKQLLSVKFARRVQHLMEPRSIEALDVAERYAHWQATADEWTAAMNAAAAAWSDADADAALAPPIAIYALESAVAAAAEAARSASSDRADEMAAQDKLLREYLTA